MHAPINVQAIPTALMYVTTGAIPPPPPQVLVDEPAGNVVQDEAGNTVVPD